MKDEIQKKRWVYRFDNYSRAFTLLQDGMAITKERPLTQLEKEGIVQRFEYTWELAWKTIKDYLEEKGIILETISPASTIKAAFAAKVIKNGELWMEALDTRNQMSHTYDLKNFETTVQKIQTDYLNLFEKLYLKLLKEIKE